MDKIRQKFRGLYTTAINYGTPINLSIVYNFGVLALIFLSIQILTGVILTMFYTPNILLAFSSVEYIMREISFGWLVRYVHSNGASFFFIIVYLHIARGLIMGSYLYPRRGLWVSGMIIFILMILTAFLGYVLPWGQMSYWAATVITNLVSVVPIVGQEIVIFLWGSFSVDNPTLNKFYTLHFIFPFLILSLVAVHFILLHKNGSNNSLGIRFVTDKIPLAPYYILKDFVIVLFTLIIFTCVVGFNPDYLGHPDNYIPANPEQTPEHIVPEWYFLPFYAILRSIPNKTLGVLALLFSLIILLSIPFIDVKNIRSFDPFKKLIVCFFFVNYIILGFLGQKPLEEPYLSLGLKVTVIYFILIIIICMPIFEINTFNDKYKKDNTTIR